MRMILLQIPTDVAEKSFFEIADVSVALAVCLLMIILFGWYVLKLQKDFKAEKAELMGDLKRIREKREHEMKENIGVMQATQTTLQQIIISTQNLPDKIESTLK